MNSTKLRLNLFSLTLALALVSAGCTGLNITSVKADASTPKAVKPAAAASSSGVRVEDIQEVPTGQSGRKGG